MNTPEIEKELNSVLQKIGRNVLNFQRMEAMMKFLISRSFIQGNSDTLRESLSINIDRVSMLTMGNLVKEYFNTLYADQQQVDEMLISMHFKINADDEFIKNRKDALENIVNERNVLIHQLLSKLDQTSIESCKQLSKILDEQNKKTEPEYKLLQSTVTALIETAKKI